MVRARCAQSLKSLPLLIKYLPRLLPNGTYLFTDGSGLEDEHLPKGYCASNFNFYQNPSNLQEPKVEITVRTPPRMSDLEGNVYGKMKSRQSSKYIEFGKVQ